MFAALFFPYVVHMAISEFQYVVKYSLRLQEFTIVTIVSTKSYSYQYSGFYIKPAVNKY